MTDWNITLADELDIIIARLRNNDGHKFSNNNSHYTPKCLVEEILDKVGDPKGIESYLVLFSIEFATTLYNRKIKNVVITTDKYCKETAIIAKKLNYKYVLLKEVNAMDFDAVVGNPPYNDGSKLIYTNFYKKTLPMATTTILLLPCNLDSEHPKLKSHNTLIKKHSQHISRNVINDFKNIGLKEIRYIISNKDTCNFVAKKEDVLVNYKPIHPTHKRLEPRQGSLEFSKKSNYDINGTECIVSLHRDGPRIEHISNSVFNKPLPQKMKTNAKWLVLVGQNPYNGIFNTHIVKAPYKPWGYGVWALDATSKKDAERLSNWLTSDEIACQTRQMLKLKKTHTVSLSMAKLLPHYK